MFRRRMMRPRRRGFSPAPHPMLQRANELMAIEDYPGAARAFEELAQAAGDRNGAVVPYLYMQAGMARTLAGQVPAGMVHIKQALALFAARGEWLKFQRNRRRVIEQLNNLGLNNEIKTLETFLLEEFPAELEDSPDIFEQVNQASVKLPTKCPGCGAPLRSDEVEWVDSNTAECPYCGTIARS